MAMINRMNQPFRSALEDVSQSRQQNRILKSVERNSNWQITASLFHHQTHAIDIFPPIDYHLPISVTGPARHGKSQRIRLYLWWVPVGYHMMLSIALFAQTLHRPINLIY